MFNKDKKIYESKEGREFGQWLHSFQHKDGISLKIIAFFLTYAPIILVHQIL